MQTADLVDLALLAALHGPKLLASDNGPSVSGIEDYWTASKCRFDRWSTSLARVRRGESPGDASRPTSLRGLFEEILGGEVLTRVWTAVVAAFDRRRNTQDNDVVVRSVYIGHQEMRQRVLKLLSGGPGLTSGEAVEMNRLRRRTEQWTDMLLAFLAVSENVTEFAFEPSRVQGYAADLGAAPAADAEEPEPRAVLQTTLRSLARHALVEPSPSADLNARLAASIMAAFPADLFDDHGLFRSLWLLRLMKTADDAQRLMSDLFRAEATYDPMNFLTRRFS